MPLLQPDRYFDRLSSVNIARDILALGFENVLLDVDNTLRSRADGCIPKDVRAWVARAKSAGVRIVLLSNSWHVATLEYGLDLNLPVVMRALKPTPIGVARALRVLNAQSVIDVEGAEETSRAQTGVSASRTQTGAVATPPTIASVNTVPATSPQPSKATTKNTLVIGDQVFTDVLCAHLCGMTSYLVAPLSPINIKSAAWQRAAEGRILQGHVPEGACMEFEDTNN